MIRDTLSIRSHVWRGASLLLALLASLLISSQVVWVSHAATTVPLTQYSSFPVSVVGKLFIRFSSGIYIYTCTGTAMNSFNESVVETAAHCFYHPGTWESALASQIQFCPQYHDGYSPHGCWTGFKYLVSPLFSGRPPSIVDPTHDYGFLVVEPEIDSQGHRITLDKAVGGAQPTFPTSTNIQGIDVYGYPDTSSQIYKLSAMRARVENTDTGKVLNIPRGFDLGLGSSGGPWFATIGGSVYLIGNTSTSGHGQSPLFDTAWSALFHEAALVEVA